MIKCGTLLLSPRIFVNLPDLHECMFVKEKFIPLPISSMGSIVNKMVWLGGFGARWCGFRLDSLMKGIVT